MTLEIFCPSQKGHDPLAYDHPASLVSLDEQIAVKGDILKSTLARWDGAQSSPHGKQPKLILGGHSIGAYMALEIVRRRLSPVPVASVHLLFPTLHHIGQSPNARKLSWLLQANDRSQVAPWTPNLLVFVTYFISVVLRIVQILPIPIIHFLVLIAAPAQSLEMVRITAAFVLRASCVQQALHMARDEMRLVRQVQKFDDEEMDGKDIPNTKLRAYWASGDLDHWAPESTRLAVEDILGLKGLELPADILDKTTSVTGKPLSSLPKKRSFTIDEIRKVRRSSKRRALAGMVRAGASASYGLASSIGQLGYRNRQGGPPPAPSSGASLAGPASLGRTPSTSPKTLRRRPSLIAARASRRFDGSIVIEPAASQDSNGEDLDLLAKDPDDIINGVVFSPAAIEPTYDEVMGSPSIDNAKITASGHLETLNGQSTLQMPDRASIVCKLGMPHAFVLENSEKMATISSAMTIADVLDTK